MDIKLNIPPNVKYLSEHLEDLPHNCIFHKSRVGCGGTHTVLTNNENYIICVPFTSLIENKTSQHVNVLGVYGKFKPQPILDYLSDKTKPHKIMVTYDSLCNLVQIINPKDFRLLIDEMHLLFSNYSFRYEAVQCVLNNYEKFKSFCFMTATLVEKEFILKELQHIPITTAIWNENFEVTVHAMKCKKSVIPTVSNIITQFLSGRIEGNAHFFVNSVEFVKEIVSLLKLNDDNTRGVWSKYNKAKVGISLGTTSSAAKKINFFTSTSFEGCDISDPDGKIYVISDKSKSHTLVDISTSFTQIAGRVRNTKYWQNIGHIFTTTRYDTELTYDEYKVETKKQIIKANGYLKQLNNLEQDLREQVELKQDTYVGKRGNNFIFDENLVNLDLYNYKVANCLYKFRTNLSEEYQKNNFNCVEVDSVIKEDFNISNEFKEVVNECQKHDEDYLKWAFTKYPFLEQAIQFLGFEKIKELKYHAGNVKKYILPFIHIPHADKIKIHLESSYMIGQGLFVESKKLKDFLQNVYNDLGIKKTAKATDLKDFYNVKEAVKSIKNETKRGYIIINKKNQ